MRTKILSIDGGGIRGVIPAMVLAEIEQRTQRPIAELFHLIAGTSTGGILALGLTVPGPDGKPKYSASDLVGLYEAQGPRIFSRSVWHRIRSVGNVADEKYPAKGIEEVLQEYFGTIRLKEALTEVLITSYEIERRRPFFFRSQRARKDKDYDYEMTHVARATSAAPTYFEPLKEPLEENNCYALVDGGVYANNPAMCALVDVLSDQLGGVSLGDCLMVSLGTGQLTRSFFYDQAKDWGLIQWARPVMQILFDGVSETVDYQMKQLLRERYYRFQTRLDIGNDDMDDASKTNLRALRLLAEDMIRQNDTTLEALCAELVA
jgi:patatin-like phospholipase/acyl hydrolase